MPLPSPGTVYEATGPLPSHPVGSLPEETSCVGKKIESQVASPWEGITQERGVVAGPTFPGHASLSSSKATKTAKTSTPGTEELAPAGPQGPWREGSL